MIFRYQNKEYSGATAVEIVRQLINDTTDFTAQTGSTVHEFLKWSLSQMSDRLPSRELELSDRVSEEVQAHGYLSLRHDYGIGEFIS